MTQTAFEIAESLGTTVHVIYRLADEHRFIPLPQSLLFALGSLDPVGRMARFGICDVEAAIFIEELEAQGYTSPATEEKLDFLAAAAELGEPLMTYYCACHKCRPT